MTDLALKEPNNMKRKERLEALVRLGERLRDPNEYLDAVIHRSAYHNPWFTPENQKKAIRDIADYFLAEEKLHSWLARYELPEENVPWTIGLVLAGNIPLVGFHDALSVFVAGHRASIKLSDKDPYLLPYLVKELKAIDPRTVAYFDFVDQLSDYDAVIATGSNNSARYFEAYFGKHPHIIRKNRNAVAVLTGQETMAELEALGNDVFQYFGLGCRNVSKIYVPKGYVFEPLLEALHTHRDIILQNKYKNNFDYNYALFILNKVPYMANGCVILTENTSLQSHIAGLYYSYYETAEALEEEIRRRSEEIQCVVAREGVLSCPVLPFGQAQQPELWDYADGIDTMQFLLSL